MNKLAKIAIGAVTGAVIAGVGMKIINTAAIKKKEEQEKEVAEQDNVIMSEIEQLVVEAEKKKAAEAVQRGMNADNMTAMTAEEAHETINALKVILDMYNQALVKLGNVKDIKGEKIDKIQLLLTRNINIIKNRITFMELGLKENKAV